MKPGKTAEAKQEAKQGTQSAVKKGQREDDLPHMVFPEGVAPAEAEEDTHAISLEDRSQ